MKTNIPVYILILFALMSGVLLYMIANWAWTRATYKEGFENPQYTFLPSSASPNLNIAFGLADLAVDISSACGFIKVDSKLIGQSPQIPTTTTPTTTTTSNTTASATIIAITSTPTPTNTTKNIESFTSDDTTTETTVPYNTTMASTTAPYITTTAPYITTMANTTVPYTTTMANTTVPYTTTMVNTTAPYATTTVNTTAPYATTAASTTVPCSTPKKTPEYYYVEQTKAPTTEPAETTAPAPTSNANGDYTMSYTKLQIYTMYNTATGYNSSSNTSMFKIMDSLYGDLFDAAKLGEMSDANIATQWKANAAILIDDAIYNGSKFFVIDSKLKTRQCGKGLSAYFLQQIQKNKNKSSVLLGLKNAYYSVIKPRFLANKLSNLYWQNAQSLTNSDKGTFNSVVFVLNTIADLASTNKLETDLSANEVANILSIGSPFTMDSLWLYQMMSVAFEMYRFCAYFQSNGSVTSGSNLPAITTTIGKFASGYQQYLNKVNQVAPKSPLLFLSQNYPNPNDCIAFSTLSAYVNNLQ
jgi:hypothetical protein